MFRKKLYGLNTGIGIFLITLLLSGLGAFSLSNLLLYDVFTSYTPAVGKQKPRVLLIGVDEKRRSAGDDVWIPLIRTLNAFGARQINFMFFPENATVRFYQEAAQMEKLLFVRKIIGMPEEASIPRLVLVPDMVIESGVPTALSVIKRPVYGVSREQWAELRFLDETVYPFEIEAARRYHGKIPDIAGESYLVDFVGGAGTLPLIELEKILDGDLIPELVDGRSIVIGIVDPDDANIVPPILNHDEMFSPLEFHGYALETLLSNRVPKESSWIVSSVLIFLVVSLSLMTYQRLELNLSVWLTVVLFGIYLMLSWFLLAYLRVWQPVVELGFAQFATQLVYLQRKVAQDNVALQKLLLDTSAKIRERVFLPSFYESSDPWSQVVSMINQSLDLNRVILLENEPSDHRVREVKALNCKFEDIHEMRRDYERTPYSTAILKNGPIVVSKYFSDVDYDETQYLVPLVYANEVLGFWAFGIATEKVRERANFEFIVHDFGHQIAELLHYRQKWMNKQTGSQNYVQRILQLDAGAQMRQDLNKSISLIEMRLNGLEDFLNGLSTSAIVYDLFGRVVLVNETLVQLLEDHQIVPYEMTALDLITRLTGMDSGKVRTLIDNVIIERSRSTLMVKGLEESENKYLLYLSPLLKNTAGQMSTDLPTSFNLSGILCELVNVTAVEHVNAVKENLIIFVGHQLYSSMHEIKKIADKLNEESVDPKEQAQYLQLIRGKIHDSIDILQKSDTYLNQDMWNGEIGNYPVDANAAVVSATAALQEQAALRGNVFQCKFPDQVSLVFADVDETKKLFTIILLILLQDAAENTSITIQIDDQDGFMVYTVSNTGFGIPDERFQKFLFDTEYSGSNEFGRLRSILPHVMVWGGQLEGRSEVGSGTRITVRLKCFI